MQFQFLGHSYKLEFERNHKNVVVYRGSRERSVTSQHPYTKATLYHVVDGVEPKTVAVGIVGCLPTDHYSIRAGRIFALRALTYKLRKTGHSKEFLTELWRAYNDRAKVPAKAVAVMTNEQKLLPPATDASAS